MKLPTIAFSLLLMLTLTPVAPAHPGSPEHVHPFGGLDPTSAKVVLAFCAVCIVVQWIATLLAKPVRAPRRGGRIPSRRGDRP